MMIRIEYKRKEDQTVGFNDEIEKMIEGMDLNSSPPECEPFRQYWFMKAARKKVKELSDKLGRPLTACTVNMGCQVNTEREKRKAA